MTRAATQKKINRYSRQEHLQNREAKDEKYARFAMQIKTRKTNTLKIHSVPYRRESPTIE